MAMPSDQSSYIDLKTAYTKGLAATAVHAAMVDSRVGFAAALVSRLRKENPQWVWNG